MLLAATAFPVLAAAGAAGAVSMDLYVDNAAAAHCSDDGQGTQAQPYCTVSAAARVVQPGQTVHIAEGGYPEQVTLTRSGTAAAPITFTGTGTIDPYRMQEGTRVGSGLWPTARAHGFLLQGVHHVRLTGLEIDSVAESVQIEGGSDVEITRSVVESSTDSASGVRVTGGAAGVTISRTNSPSHGAFVQLDPGVRDTVISTNRSESFHSPTVRANGATGTVIVSNTFTPYCEDVISLTGTSTGTVIENNVLSTTDGPPNRPNPVCDRAGSLTAVRVDAAAARGTKLAYNLYDAQDGSPAYTWAGTSYSTVAAFAAASGQGSHDLVGNVELNEQLGDSDGKNSPLVDSADESAPGMLDADMNGLHATDDPWVPDSGTGSGRRDRGAVELANFGARYTPVGPVRVLDTRTGVGTAVAAGGSIDLPLAGANGVPATGVTAVSMNVTVTQGAAPGFLTVYPHGDDRPVVSSLNWAAGQTIPNLVTVQVKDGKVTLFNGSQGTVHLVADLLGFYSTTGSGFHATSPARLLDTRTAKSPIGAGGSLDLPLAGVQGIPADLTAVTLNVTVTQPTAAGYLTVYPTGTARPTASSLNWAAGQTIPNLVTVPVKNGKVTLYNGSWGTTHVVADLAGYFTASGGDKFHALSPRRVLDTRLPQTGSDPGDWVPGTPIGPGNLRYDSEVGTEITAQAYNVTAIRGTAPGYLTVYQTGGERPLASNLNWTAGQTIPNAVVVAHQGFNAIGFYNGSSGPVDLAVDSYGFYAH